MTKPIIYLQKQFRPEFLTQINELAPDYEISYTLTDEQLTRVEIVFGWNKQEEERLLTAPNLKWIQTISAGVDYLPFEKLAEKKIVVSNASGLHATSIAEHVMAVLFTHSRGIDQALAAQNSATWLTQQRRFMQLDGKKILVVGTGQIGEKIGEKSKGLGLKTYGVNTTGHSVANFEECFAMKNLYKIVGEMDIVVNVLPLTSATHFLYGKEFFEAMKASAYFVNVGRGPSVHTTSLVNALETDEIAFAALDVFEEEPLPKDHPLWQNPNVLITPHFSGWTPDFQNKLMAIFKENLTSFVTSEKLSRNSVDLTKGY